MDFPFDFRTHPPGPALAPYVQMLWYARGQVPYNSEQIGPTGTSVAILVLGDPLEQTPAGGAPIASAEGLFIGPHDRPVRNRPLGETHAIGIVTTPVGAGPCFGVAPRAHRGQVRLLTEVWPHTANLRNTLLTDFPNNPDAQLAHVAHTLEAHLQPASGGFARCARAVDTLLGQPSRSIADIARELGISHAHLDREFARHVGLTPRMLSRIARMRALLAAVDTRNGTDWAHAAAELGWYDQAHLIRDFKRHMGLTPSQYVAAQRAVYGDLEPGEGAGFAPEA